MEIVLPGQIFKEIDQQATQEFGFPPIILMENAGERMFQVLKLRYAPCDVAVLVGKGNNGGDGLVIARKLDAAGFKVKVYLFANSSEELSSACQSNFKIHQNLGIPYQWVNEGNFQDYQEEILSKTLLLDALIGIGLNSPVKGFLMSIVERLNDAYEGTLVAVDVPTGLGTEDEYYEPVLKADLTLCVEAYKLNMLDYPGRADCGDIQIIKIDFPVPLMEKAENSACFLLQESDLKLPFRRRDSHKGTYGKVLVLAGSEDFSGAAQLVLQAALKTGAGYIYYAGTAENLVKSNFPEVICLSEKELDFDKFDSILAGPGWGVNESREQLLRLLLEKYRGRLILDADAVNILAKNPSLLELLMDKAHVLLTPHIKEGARLLKTSPEKLKRQKVKYLKEFSLKYPAVSLLLKDSVSLLESEGKIYYLPWGNDFLARGGSGDLLAGLIAGLAGFQSLEDAAKLAAYLNGRSAELLVQEKGAIGNDHSMLIDFYGKAFLELQDH